MRALKRRSIAVLILLSAAAPAAAPAGGFDFNIGYNYVDEDGNRSVNQSSYNYYDGVGLSLENFRYVLNNGLIIDSDIENVNLENRRLYFSISKPGLFGADISSNRSRRVYNFEGTDYTKRDLTFARLWVRPSRYVKVFARADFNKLSGNITDLFGSSFIALSDKVDYNRNKYVFGARLLCRGRMLEAEYGTAGFNDNIDGGNDQKRNIIKIAAQTPVPRFDWVVLTGSFRRFRTEFKETGFGLESGTFKGGFLAKLPHNFSLNYNLLFNRAGSDSDLVKTDNLAHTLYLSFIEPHTGGLTVGYQNNTNDDYEASVNSNSIYLSGWISPLDHLDLKAIYGFKTEDVDEGSRLTGDEERNRLELSARYRFGGRSSLKITLADRKRKNEQPGTETSYLRSGLEGWFDLPRYASIAAGYSLTDGDYKNIDDEFEYTNHQIHLSINTHEYKNFSGGFTLIYYRSRRDLDTEGSDLRFNGVYGFKDDLRIELTYNIFNFDDYLFMDRYYTANIAEFNIIKTFKF